MIIAYVPVSMHKAERAMVRHERHHDWAVQGTPECVPELLRHAQLCTADAVSITDYGALFGHPETTVCVRVTRRRGRLVVRDVLPTFR